LQEVADKKAEEKHAKEKARRGLENDKAVHVQSTPKVSKN